MSFHSAVIKQTSQLLIITSPEAATKNVKIYASVHNTVSTADGKNLLVGHITSCARSILSRPAETGVRNDRSDFDE